MISKKGYGSIQNEIDKLSVSSEQWQMISNGDKCEGMQQFGYKTKDVNTGCLEKHFQRQETRKILSLATV